MSKVKTSKVKERRSLRFGRLTDLVSDVEQFEGRARSTGNWTPAQVVDHVSRVIQCSLDGFPAPNASILIRGVAKMMRSSVLNKPMRAGLKYQEKFDFFDPPADVTWEDATTRLKRAIARIDKGEKMPHRSPVLGFLEHEEWIQFHCRHAEMHFSFLHPEAVTESRADEPASEPVAQAPDAS